MESIAQKSLSISLEQTLKKMYEGYLSSEYADLPDRLERTQIFCDYQEMLELIKKVGSESAE